MRWAPTDCAASTSVSAPTLRAAAAIAFMSVTNPGANVMLGIVTSRVRSSIAAAIASTGTCPYSGATGRTSIPCVRTRLYHR